MWLCPSSAGYLGGSASLLCPWQLLFMLTVIELHILLIVSFSLKTKSKQVFSLLVSLLSVRADFFDWASVRWCSSSSLSQWLWRNSLSGGVLMPQSYILGSLCDSQQELLPVVWGDQFEAREGVSCPVLSCIRNGQLGFQMCPVWSRKSD